LVSAGDRLAAAVAGEFVDRAVDRDFGGIGIELLEGGAEMAGEDDGFAGGASEGTIFAEGFAVGVEGFPAEELVKDFGEGRVFEGFFGVGVRLTHGVGLSVLNITYPYCVPKVPDRVRVQTIDSCRFPGQSWIFRKDGK
jgi:hypothetical protein